MEIISTEKINERFGIVLQQGETIGYEICISDKNMPYNWYETDGFYSLKKDAMKVYNEMKKEYKRKACKDAINKIKGLSDGDQNINLILNYVEKHIIDVVKYVENKKVQKNE